MIKPSAPGRDGNGTKTGRKHEKCFLCPSRGLGGALLVAVISLTVAAGSAEAATIEFTVKNDRGAMQSSVNIKGWKAAVVTEPDGTKLLTDVDPGDVLSFSRCQFGGLGGDCTAPEAPSGVSYTVPATPPAQVEIILPSLQDPNYVPHQPTLSNDERGMLGLINDERTSRGLGELQASSVLADVADRSANYADATDGASFYSFGVRWIDAGWPWATGDAGGESRWIGPASRATDLSGSNGQLFKSSYDSIGIAVVGERWVAVVGTCPDPYADRCELQGDTGDSRLLDDPVDPGSDPGGKLEKPGMRLKSAKRKDSLVKLRYALDRRASGRAALTLRKGTKTRRVRLRRRGGALLAKARLGRGTWRARVVFAGDERFRSTQTCHKLKLERLDKDKRGRWVQLRSRSC